MNKILIFAFGVACGMVIQTLLLFLYASLRINNIDKKQ